MGIRGVVVGASNAIEEFFVREVLDERGFQVGGAKILAGVGGCAVHPMTTGALRLVDSFSLSKALLREE